MIVNFIPTRWNSKLIHFSGIVTQTAAGDTNNRLYEMRKRNILTLRSFYLSLKKSEIYPHYMIYNWRSLHKVKMNLSRRGEAAQCLIINIVNSIPIRGNQIFPFPCSDTQSAGAGGVWRMECPNNTFPQPTLLYTGYNVKLKNNK